jgi:hypothetical protein
MSSESATPTISTASKIYPPKIYSQLAKTSELHIKSKRLLNSNGQERQGQEGS